MLHAAIKKKCIPSNKKILFYKKEKKFKRKTEKHDHEEEMFYTLYPGIYISNISHVIRK